MPNNITNYTIPTLFFLLVLILGTSCSDPEPAKLDIPQPTKTLDQSMINKQFTRIPFTEVSKQMGVDFLYEDGAEGDKWAPETMIGGVAFFDFDNDGDADLLTVSGNRWDQLKNNTGENRIALFRNNNGKSFTNVTQDTGLHFTGYGFGIAIGDYDNDGWQDIYLTTLGTNYLFKNEKGKQFIDVTKKMNVQGKIDGYSVGASFFDADNDGDLDLFVANYITWNRAIDSRSNEQVLGKKKAYSGPVVFQGAHPYFFRNLGKQGFREESKIAGLQVSNNNEIIGKPLGILPIDINNDHYIDLVIANDLSRNFAFINTKEGNFSEQGETIGIAYNNIGKSTAAMGIDAAWLSNTQTLTIAMGNYSGEMTSIYRKNNKHLVFSDDAPVTGIGPKSRKALTFGALFLDLDLDGRMDFLQTNGHVEPDIALTQKSHSYKQPAQLFWNCGQHCPRQFTLLPASSVGDLYEPLVGRGLTSADFDNDGDIDIAVSEVGGKLRLFRNDQKTNNNWIKLKLRQNDNNIFSIGATVEIQHGNSIQKQLIMPTRSYVSQVDSTLVFGLGNAARADKIIVTWPDGKQQYLENITANQTLTVYRK